MVHLILYINSPPVIKLTAAISYQLYLKYILNQMKLHTWYRTCTSDFIIVYTSFIIKFYMVLMMVYYI